MRIAAIIVLGLLVSGCEFYSLVPRPLIKTVGNLSIISAGTVMATDKTIPDHLASYRNGKDCSSVRVEQGRTYCKEDEPNPIPVAHCYRTIGDVTCYAEPDPARQPGDLVGNL